MTIKDISRGTRHHWWNDTCLHLGFHCRMRLVACYTSANTLAPSNHCQLFQTEFCNHAPGWFFHRYILKESVCLKAGDHFIKMSPFLPCLWPWNEHQLTTPSWYVIWRVQPAGSMSLLLRRVLLTSCTRCITRPIQHHSSLSSPAFITSTICIRQQEHLPPMFGRCPVML